MNGEEGDILADLSRAYTQLRRRFDRAMYEQGASFAQTRMLLCIEAAKGKACASDLADQLAITPHTVTEALDVLERDGLVTRSPDASDRRVKRLIITAAGTEAVGATEPLRRQLSAEILSRLEADERRDLHGLLRKLLHALTI
jgi:DNA-binding MarR family transcriptional regulator